MPATLDQAFQSPFHKMMGTSGSSGTNSIRNPDYYAFQNNFHVKSAMDIETEADDLKSIYNTLPTIRKNAADAIASSGSSSTTSSHDCHILIAQILACPKCRNRVRELLKSGDELEIETHADKPQSGGGDLGNLDLKSVLVNIILGILLILLVEFVLRS